MASPMEIAITHYEALKKYLFRHLAREQANGSRTNAREKLTRLTKVQFQELSTDVYDELTRRLMDTNEVPFLPVRDEFHPKRNQARQKLATLPQNRFKDLASDVYYELERRYPELKDMEFSSTPASSRSNTQPQNPQQNPQQNKIPSDGVKSQTSRANNIVPEISTLVQETISVDYHVQKQPEMQKINNNNNNDSEVTSPQSYSSSSPTNNNNTNNYPPVPEGMPPEYNSPRSPRSRTQSSASSVSDFGRRYANGMSVSSMSSMSSKNTQNRDTVNSQKSNKPPDAAVNFASLDSLMADLGDMIDKKASGSASSSPKQPQVQTFPYAEVEKVKSDYELRIANLQKRIKELENELSTKEAGTDDDSARVRELEKQLEEQKQINKKQTTKMTELEREFDKLTEDHHQQQEVANDVQKEATGLLEEIKEISKRNEELCAEKEDDAEKIKSLMGEINDWKNKYEKIRTELRNLKATSSFYKEAPKVDIVKDNSLAPTPDGGIEESRIVSYQVAIDDLLRSGRSDDPTNVLMAMKSIVIACKSITEEVDNYEQRKSAYMNAEDKSNLDACKARLSVTLKNLMTSAKNHATGYGISPVSLLDASAGHLTATIVDLVKAVKLRRERGQNNNLNPDSYPFQIPSEPLPTNNFSSEIAPLRTKNSQNEMNSGSDNQMNGVKTVDIDELKDFLERQTEAIVHAIHTLLQAIRGGATYSTSSDLTDNINTITSIVLTVIKVCQDSFKSSAGAIYRTRGDIILKELENNVDKLEEMNDLIAKDSTDFMSNKTSKQRLAGASFEIAKFTKELVGLVKKDD
ncbi:hypothetical protein C1646_664967 [Rhizophagus diaphanus]|nr:hypothetical protein C1646_664967 [Rhizophagus diaphanus] [Rhizophagus sp. MUCL 43196]